jgi:hypothetical protein
MVGMVIRVRMVEMVKRVMRVRIVKMVGMVKRVLGEWLTSWGLPRDLCRS